MARGRRGYLKTDGSLFDFMGGLNQVTQCRQEHL